MLSKNLEKNSETILGFTNLCELMLCLLIVSQTGCCEEYTATPRHLSAA